MGISTKSADMSPSTWGDEMIMSEENIFRVYFKNIQGLHLQRTSTDLIYYMETMKSWGRNKYQLA